MMNTIISPSLLSCDFLNIEKELSYFKGIDGLWLHLDIMDGHFVPNLTFGTPIVKKIANKTSCLLDAHLMVSNPEFYIEQFKDIPLHNFTFHLEATDNPTQLVKKAKQYFKSVGVSIKPMTPVEQVSANLFESIDLLLVMSVEPGFGGQSFIESTYEKLEELKELKEKHGFTIQVDGGVSNHNSSKLINHGVDNLVAGSYIFKDGPKNYLEKINSLR